MPQDLHPDIFTLVSLSILDMLIFQYNPPFQSQKPTFKFKVVATPSSSDLIIAIQPDTRIYENELISLQTKLAYYQQENNKLLYRRIKEF